MKKAYLLLNFFIHSWLIKRFSIYSPYQVFLGGWHNFAKNLCDDCIDMGLYNKICVYMMFLSFAWKLGFLCAWLFIIQAVRWNKLLFIFIDNWQVQLEPTSSWTALRRDLSKPSKYTGMFQASKDIFREEGIRVWYLSFYNYCLVFPNTYFHY